MRGTFYRHMSFFMGLILTLSLTACFHNKEKDSPTRASLVSFTLSAEDQTLVPGNSTGIVANGVYSDNSSKRVTGNLSWQSDNPLIAGVDGNGIVTAYAAGNVVISATEPNSGLFASLSFTITSSELIQLSLNSPEITAQSGARFSFLITGTLADSSQQTMNSGLSWSSSDETVAAVNSEGVIEARLPGQTVITVTHLTSGVWVTGVLTVIEKEPKAIGITPGALQIAVGESFQLSALAIYDNGTAKTLYEGVTWSSNDTSVVSVNENGVITGVSPGQNTVLLSINGLQSAAPAQAFVTVLSQSYRSLEITSTSGSSQIVVGSSLQLTASALLNDNSYKDVSTEVIWSSSDSSKLIVDQSGYVTALASITEPVVIYASLPGNNVFASLELSVITGTLQQLNVQLANAVSVPGLVVQATAEGTFENQGTGDVTASVNWSSDNPAVATVSNFAGTKGIISVLAQGSAIITATDSTTNLTAQSQLVVQQPSALTISHEATNNTLALGQQLQLNVLATLADNSTLDISSIAGWVSADTSKLTVNSTGLLTAVGEGTGVLIIASYLQGSMSASLAFDVLPKVIEQISVSSNAASVGVGAQIDLTATAIYSDETTLDLTDRVNWSSDNDAIATVSDVAGSKGRVVGVAEGTALISVSDVETGLTASYSVVVTTTSTDITLVSLAITPSDIVLVEGEQRQFSATATYSDNSVRDITNTVSWVSSNSAIASFSTDPGSEGLLLVNSYRSGIVLSASDPDNVLPAVSVTLDVLPAQFAAEGNQAAPVSISNLPYDSINNANPHMVATSAISYYQFDVTANTNYIVKLYNVSDDVSLFVYADNQFGTEICRSTFIATSSEYCGFNSGFNTTFYLRIVHEGALEGALFELAIAPEQLTLSIDNAEPVTYHEGVGSNEPLVWAALNRTTNPPQIEIFFRNKFDNTSFTYQQQFDLIAQGSGVGTYYLGSDASAFYADRSTLVNDYVDDSVEANGSITLDQVDTSGRIIRGSYHLTLCANGHDCADSANQSTFIGDFQAVREPNIVLSSQGQQIAPFVLTGNSVNPIFYDSSINLRRHLVDNFVGSSFYAVTVNGHGGTVQVTLTNPVDSANGSGSNFVELLVYSNPDFANANLVCSASAVSSLQCSGALDLAISALYIRINYTGSGSGASYDLRVEDLP